MTINLHLPSQHETLRPAITVIGVGGAGGNAVNNMINSRLEGVEFVVANTDAQALQSGLADCKIQLGANITRGLGAGADPQVGAAAAEEAMDEILSAIEGSNMVFITAGMGGGTGTGAAPVIARAAKEQGVLTVGVVTKPFQFEGGNRMRLAENGLKELQQYVDTLIVIPNQNLFRIATEKTTFADAFRMADEVLHSGVRGVTDLMVKPGLVNLDFADIRTVMREMGKAMMGTGEATGEKRAVEAAEAAISNPLLEDVSLKGARAALINITGGLDMTLFEVDEAANRIREEVDPEANIIFGSTFNEELQGIVRVSVVATGIDADAARQDIEARAQTVRTARRPFTYAAQGPLPRKEGTSHQTSQPQVAAASSSASANAAPKAAARSQGASAQAEYETEVRVRREEPRAAETPQAPQHHAPARREASYASDAFVFDAPRPAYETATGGYVQEPVVAAHEHREYPRREQPQPDAGPLFVSPRQHAQPVARHRGSEALAVMPEEEPRAPQARPAAAAPAFKFLNRLADVGRAISARIEDQEKEAVATRGGRTAVEVAERRGADLEPADQHGEEEDYDIPAFLRRQVN